MRSRPRRCATVAAAAARPAATGQGFQLRELPGLIGAIAVTVPLANGPTLVGAAGAVTMAVDCRKARERRTVSSICTAFTKGQS